MTKQKDGTHLIEDAQLIFRNFEGRKTMYNRQDDQNFCVLLEKPEDIKALEADGFAIKMTKDREEDEVIIPGHPYLKVKLGWEFKPPRIMIITSKARTPADQETSKTLDDFDIAYADLIIRPYHWDMGEGADRKTGVTAYLQSLYLNINEDALALKYAEED